MEVWESFPSFLYSTQGNNPARIASDFIFLLPLQSIQKYSFSNPAILQKVISPKPSIRLGQVNNRWKDKKVFHNFGIQVPVRIQTEQCQISILWLLLGVKAELTLMLNFPVWRCAVRFERTYSP
jgi:hypothetical protein